jgi:hypothetical protein
VKTALLDPLFDFVLLLSIVAFGITIAVAHVEERTSYGLLQIIGILGVLAGNRSARWRPLVNQKGENQ